VLGALAAIPSGAGGGIPVSDLAWARLAPWRELLARALDTAAARPFVRGVERITVRGGPVSGGAAEAVLLAGWLADRLRVPVLLQPADGAEAGLTAVILEARSADSRLRAEVSDTGRGLAAGVEIDGVGVAASHVPNEPPRLAELVGAALQQQGSDPIYAAALRSAVALIR
jgi:glucose-6-phosphate dehydrogenase assembly protein OpcA